MRLGAEENVEPELGTFRTTVHRRTAAHATRLLGGRGSRGRDGGHREVEVVGRDGIVEKGDEDRAFGPWRKEEVTATLPVRLCRGFCR